MGWRDFIKAPDHVEKEEKEEMVGVGSPTIPSISSISTYPRVPESTELHELRVLIRRAAHHWQFPDGELNEAIGAAMRDPVEALESYRVTAKKFGLLSDDRVYCDTDCARYKTGYCEHYRGVIGKEWAQPRRCEGFRPLPDDKDQRDGVERWPSLLEPINSRRTRNGA